MTWEGYLGILGVIASIAFGYLAFSRNKKADDSTEGRQIGTIWPWHGRNDWNDVLREGGKGVGDWRRRVA